MPRTRAAEHYIMACSHSIAGANQPPDLLALRSRTCGDFSDCRLPRRRRRRWRHFHQTRSHRSDSRGCAAGSSVHRHGLKRHDQCRRNLANLQRHHHQSSDLHAPGLRLALGFHALHRNLHRTGQYRCAANRDAPRQSVADTSILNNVTINIVVAMMFTTTTLPGGENGVPYSEKLAVTGGVAPLKFTLASGTLPAGLSLGTTGEIAGTPSGSGTSQFTVQVADGATPPATLSQSFSITIAPAQPISSSPPRCPRDSSVFSTTPPSAPTAAFPR